MCDKSRLVAFNTYAYTFSKIPSLCLIFADFRENEYDGGHSKYLFNCWKDFDKTWQEASTERSWPSLVFIRSENPILIEKCMTFGAPLQPLNMIVHSLAPG